MLLTVQDIHKSYQTADGPFAVLRGIDLTLQAGETLALTGESGSGKSTLLHLIGGLDTPDSGQILHEGRDIAALDDAGRAALRRGTVGVVFQQFNLIPSLRVADNIAFQARLAGKHDPAWDAALAERMGLTPHLAKYPEQLSGGQQQRVAIARTLAPKPRVVLADEPTGNLDEATANTVLDLMLELVAETGAGLLMVTHSEGLAAAHVAPPAFAGRAGGMTTVTLQALLSHWWRNPLQLFTLLAGLALATALWSGVQAVNAEARASYDAAAATLGEGQYDRLVRRDGQPMAQDTYIALRRAGWLVSPVVQGRLNGVRLIGIDPLTAPGGIGPVAPQEGTDIAAFLTGAGQLFANAETAAQLTGLNVIITS